MKKPCLCCKQMFLPNRYHPHQQYCSEPACQRYRRNLYQRKKIKTDKDYQGNQSDAQKSWRARHPDYWRSYRAFHPAYVKRNRENARQNRQIARKQPQPEMFANMDVASLQLPLKTGRYEMHLCDGSDVAKMDFVIVELTVLQPVTKTG